MSTATEAYVLLLSLEHLAVCLQALFLPSRFFHCSVRTSMRRQKKQDNVEQTTHVEHINEVQLEAPKTSSEANAEPADADVVEDEDPIGAWQSTKLGTAEETQTESTEVLSLSEVDDMPTMADGSNITQGISAYLKSQIPELSKKKVYVEFKISETGHIYDVDASLVSDARVKSKIEKLLTTIKVKPGRKDGHVVAVKTSLNIYKLL